METIMKNRTLIAALVLITLSGCVSLGEYVGNTPLPGACPENCVSGHSYT